MTDLESNMNIITLKIINIKKLTKEIQNTKNYLKF